MIKKKKLRFWFGSYGWGWNLWGVSFGDDWFIGFSRKATTFTDQRK